MGICGDTDQQQRHDYQQGNLKGLWLTNKDLHKSLLRKSLQSKNTYLCLLTTKEDLLKAPGYQKGPITTNKKLQKVPDCLKRPRNTNLLLAIKGIHKTTLFRNR